MAKQTFQGRPVVAGDINGKALLSKQPFNPTSSYIENIWGGATDKAPCTDQDNKELFKKDLNGVILCTSQCIGSSMGGAAFMAVAGLGVAPGEPDPDWYDHIHAHCDVLIVGAGPAGLMAALAAGLATISSQHAHHGLTEPRQQLALIDELDYCGYFLTMWEIVRYCRSQGILCQGRGSAANSAICYVLGITSVNPDKFDLLFERFLNPERVSMPDVDIDFCFERRDEVIDFVNALSILLETPINRTNFNPPPFF